MNAPPHALKQVFPDMIKHAPQIGVVVVNTTWQQDLTFGDGRRFAFVIPEGEGGLGEYL
ncbi:hypothetical protein [Herbaspirillum autotrophicum]|uniref:hypothetical protein n=1 Tax=Herbaspirillum autotrophicum TaxID=180195 RepID=UPI000ACDC900|nr:hypothetical protein [Herbaspirillum autotrophicum]